jgi:DNA polymerase-4
VGRTVQLKLRYADFSTITRSTTLARPTNVTNEIWTSASSLLEDRLPARRLEVRLIGVGLHQLSPDGDQPRTLFEDESHEKQSGADRVSDVIRGKFGSQALRRGATLGDA